LHTSLHVVKKQLFKPPSALLPAAGFVTAAKPVDGWFNWLVCFFLKASFK
jgi:hypothetical protein